MSKRKIVFVVNDLSFFVSHRLCLAKKAIKNNYQVTIAFGETGKASLQELTSLGIRLEKLALKKGGKNLFFEIIAFVNIVYLFIKIKPDIAHLVTIKPYLYGGIAARIARVPAVLSAVSGLGTFFCPS